ncbi:MAG: hypothetical protein DMF93_01060 [Acidobacteria bacterium]|nr:MAG: hypothetical protein DMF93_01060 [Acidobacteriota bacterium]
MLAAAGLCVAALAFAAPARAQIFTGRIDVTVEDQAGAPRPGVAVELGGAETRAQTTDATGRAHFVDLPSGTYSVKLTLAGFAPHTSSRVEVEGGASTALDIRLQPTGAAEAADAEIVSPMVDARRSTTTTNISLAELQELPLPRDVWAALPMAPTVYVDRVNVGGSESGHQLNFNAKGALSTDNAWTVDGVPVTDVGEAVEPRPELSTGASPFYYDVDTVHELAVRTGGADVRSPASGAVVNVVLRRGENLPHATTRFFYADQRLQTTNISSDLQATLGAGSAAGNRTDKYQEYGFDLGGPLLKDSVWIWGSMAKTTINLLTLGGAADDTSLSNLALKVEGRWKPGVSGAFTFYDSDKTEDGRGAGPARPAETTWHQTGPSTLYKGAGNFARTRLFATVRGAFVDAGIQLVPVGGAARDYYIDDAGVAHGTYFQYQTTRPQHYYAGDASYFAGPHDVSFGGAWRSMSADTLQTWPASHLVASWAGYPALLVQVSRDYHAVTSARYLDAYVADTLSFGRITLTAGLRVDRQSSSLGAASVPGVANFESVLPAVSAAPIDDVFTWTNLTPRVSATYALDASRKTIVRGSYAVFASQMPGSLAEFASPIQYAFAYYNAVDRNGDGSAQANEVQIAQGLQGFTGFDPKNPSRATSVNQTDPSAAAPITHEIAVGADREIARGFGVSATFTYRRMQDLLWTPLVGVTRADYQQTSTLTGTAAEVGAFSVPLYALRPAAVPAGAGKVATNRPGYHQQYVGFEASATRRLASRWMARVGFSTNNWREHFDDPAASILDPTPAPAASTAWPFAGPQVSGGPVVRLTGDGAPPATFMTAPGYQFAASGLYQARWGIDVAASLVSREGYAEPFFESDVQTGDPLGRKSVLIAKHADDFRLPAVTTFDLRLGKTFTFAITKLAVDFDVFNLFNSATVLARQLDARLTGPTGFDQVLEVMNPRIARIGVRFAF